MRSSRPSRAVAHAVAIGAVMAAGVVRLALTPVLEDHLVWLTFFPAVMLAAWYGGLGPGLTATGLSVVTAVVVVVGIGEVLGAGPARPAGAMLFAAIGVGFSLAVDRIDRARRRLAEAVRLRDEFLTIASHELRTPLASLVLRLGALERQLAAGGDPAALDRLEAARRSTARLEALIDQVLEVARVETGAVALAVEEVDLAELAREVVGAHAYAAERAGCALRLHAAAAPARVDRARIVRVAGELVRNALKFGRGGPVDVTVAPDRGGVRLEVADRGPGIPSADHARIFDRFERAASSRHYGGLGLGLYVARTIVDAHGGTIGVASSPGAGATFHVWLPRGGPAPAAAG